MNLKSIIFTTTILLMAGGTMAQRPQGTYIIAYAVNFESEIMEIEPDSSSINVAVHDTRYNVLLSALSFKEDNTLEVPESAEALKGSYTDSTLILYRTPQDSVIMHYEVTGDDILLYLEGDEKVHLIFKKAPVRKELVHGLEGLAYTWWEVEGDTSFYLNGTEMLFEDLGKGVIKYKIENRQGIAPIVYTGKTYEDLLLLNIVDEYVLEFFNFYLFDDGKTAEGYRAITYMEMDPAQPPVLYNLSFIKKPLPGAQALQAIRNQLTGSWIYKGDAGALDFFSSDFKDLQCEITFNDDGAFTISTTGKIISSSGEAKDFDTIRSGKWELGPTGDFLYLTDEGENFERLLGVNIPEENTLKVIMDIEVDVDDFSQIYNAQLTLTRK